jgi:hypothetical protein
LSIELNDFEKVLCDFVHYKKVEGCQKSNLKLKIHQVKLTGQEYPGSEYGDDDLPRYSTFKKEGIAGE